MTNGWRLSRLAEKPKLIDILCGLCSSGGGVIAVCVCVHVCMYTPSPVRPNNAVQNTIHVLSHSAKPKRMQLGKFLYTYGFSDGLGDTKNALN